MSLNVSRTTEPLRFDVGIGSAGYADVMTPPEAGGPERALLPGTTTVSQAIDDIFPPDRGVGGEIMAALVAGNPATLRTSGGFADAAASVLRSLKGRRSEAADKAANEIENLLADAALLEHFRLALLET